MSSLILRDVVVINTAKIRIKDVAAFNIKSGLPSVCRFQNVTYHKAFGRLDNNERMDKVILGRIRCFYPMVI